MYGPRYAAGSSVQATRKKIKQREDKVFVAISESLQDKKN